MADSLSSAVKIKVTKMLYMEMAVRLLAKCAGKTFFDLLYD